LQRPVNPFTRSRSTYQAEPSRSTACQIQEEHDDVAVQTRSPQNAILVNVTNLPSQDDPEARPLPQGAADQADESQAASSLPNQQGSSGADQPSTIPVPASPVARSPSTPNVVPTPEATSVQTATPAPDPPPGTLAPDPPPGTLAPDPPPVEPQVAAHLPLSL